METPSVSDDSQPTEREMVRFREELRLRAERPEREAHLGDALGGASGRSGAVPGGETPNPVGSRRPGFNRAQESAAQSSTDQPAPPAPDPQLRWCGWCDDCNALDGTGRCTTCGRRVLM